MKNNISNLNSNAIVDEIQRYREYLSEEDFKAILKGVNKISLSTIRPNPFKNNINEIVSKWAEIYAWNYRKVPIHPFAIQVTSSTVSISQTIEHRMGEYYLQDMSSLLPVALYDPPQSGSLILDMAASPGGKTTQLMDLTDDQSLILANDSSPSRMQALRVVLQNWGAMDYITTNFPGENFGSWFPNKFDLILLDAPCTMQSLKIPSNRSIRETSFDERDRLSSRQKGLLESAFKALKPGGQLIYSTCSLAPEEDEFVVDALLKKYKNNFEITENKNLKITAPGLERFDGVDFDQSLRHAIRLWPHIFDTPGFFAVKISKKYSTSAITSEIPRRKFESYGLVELTSKEISNIASSMIENYNVRLTELLHRNNFRIFKRNDTLFLFPESYFLQVPGFPFYTAGIILGSFLKDQFIPSHEFVSRYQQYFLSNAYELPESLLPIWLTGRDIRHFKLNGTKNNQIVICKDSLGRYLGRGKILQDRIRNLLPTRFI